ncbi:MAG: hypothetical protein JSR60_11940 [Proteobacteria bacterium]|nr:hypothetical protein [Pseudomonadota bacterium]
MGELLRIRDYLAGWSTSPFAEFDGAPWIATQGAGRLIRAALKSLTSDYRLHDDIAIHVSAIVEPGAVLKGPAIIGPDCFVAAGSYLRGGVYLDRNCIVGPNAELKTSFMFPGSKIAHLNFVGDSILGSNVNIEAGAIVANYRNECEDKTIRIATAGSVIDTGVDKFGALVGDNTRIGANAVIAPGALLAPNSRVGRLALIDQSPAGA